MGLIVHVLFLALTCCCLARSVADKSLEECTVNAEIDRRSAATLLQREVQSASRILSKGHHISYTDKDLGPTYAEAGDLPELQKAESHMSHEEKEISIALSMTLIGMVVFVTIILYLTNWPASDIRRATWTVLNQSLNIFCSVLLFEAFEKTVKCYNGESPPPATDAPHHPAVKDMYSAFGRLILLMIAYQVGMLWSRRHEKWIAPLGFLGSHIVGFATIAAFGDLQQWEPWNRNPAMSLLLGIIVAALLCGCYGICGILRDRTEDANSRMEWRAQCCESEDDAAGLALGLLLTQVIKFTITGELAPVHGSPLHKTRRQILLLALTASLFTVFYIGLSKLLRASSCPQYRRALCMVMAVCSMTQGWCLLYCGQWAFWTKTGNKGFGEGCMMSARLFMVGFFGLAGFLLIFLMNLLTSKGVLSLTTERALSDSIGLVLGLSWEACVTVAMEGLHHAFPSEPRGLLHAGADLCIALIVAPAWAFYILPQTIELMEEDESNDGGITAWGHASRETVSFVSKRSANDA